MFVELRFLIIIFNKMFPYNDDEIDWISKTSISTKKTLKHSLFYSILLGLAVAVLSTTIPTIIYFSKLNLI
tara:strand:- start:166 stop:378 length:213 start_codon:yes stop_codon:yes gene_type:complete